MRILLVEDDAMIGEEVRAALREASYAADWVRDGNAAYAALDQQDYDAVLLDLGLPGADGLSVLRQLRRHATTPVLILTARDGVQDRIDGLDSGADDYILKPFAMGELLARLRAVMRRKSGAATVVLDNGELSLDLADKTARWQGQAPVTLSAREFALLQALMHRPGAILSRSELEERIYGWGEEVESNAVEFLIHALRKKLDRTAIRNVRGMGWMVARGASAS
ncbi:response regulator transcription factor [Herbaspirillum huttiense]|uniref:Response regulator transcription factor n=1 Tax=Herbaspirillum huttiense subsp. lycopersici TaxID=3074428 RepID=A0ABU2EIT5_9BURK|nr:response regulator transcription factor [Herbaspirillum huttiense]MDR9847752.1 response regulator transcription factor [Herbaspirillum huttiense SE1]